MAIEGRSDEVLFGKAGHAGSGNHQMIEPRTSTGANALCSVWVSISSDREGPLMPLKVVVRQDNGGGVVGC